MRWSEYLTAHPVEAEVLVNDLTMAYGSLAFMVRQLSRNDELAAVIGCGRRGATDALGCSR